MINNQFEEVFTISTSKQNDLEKLLLQEQEEENKEEVNKEEENEVKEEQEEKINELHKVLAERVDEVKDLKKSVQEVEKKLSEKDLALQAALEDKIKIKKRNTALKLNAARQREKTLKLLNEVKDLKKSLQDKDNDNAKVVKEKEVVVAKHEIVLSQILKDLKKRLAEEKVKQKKLIEKEADEVKDLMKRVGEKKGFRILQEIQKKQLSENDFAHQEAAHKHKEEGSEMIIDLVLEKPSFKRKL